MEAEKNLLNCADVAFTGGRSLYEAKSALHHNIHCFPSAVDQSHFAQALSVDEAIDQKEIPGPRLGFFGVIDERFDTYLLNELAALKPDWSFVMIGPVVKVDPSSLPQRPNIHWLGGRDYKELPSYLAGWDLAIMPFALNDSTRFISPTKTPEFLSAGLQVVSTPIRDVVSPYGELGLVEIAQDANGFADAATRLLRDKPEAWKQDVARFLNGYDWDSTWARMHEKVLTALLKKKRSDHARSVGKGLTAGQVEIAHNA